MTVKFEILPTDGRPLYPNGIKEFKVSISNDSSLTLISANFSVAIATARTEIPKKLHLHYKHTDTDANTGAVTVTDKELDLTEGVEGYPHSKSWVHNLTDTELSDLQDGGVDILFEIQTSKGADDTITDSDFSDGFPEPFITFIMPKYVVVANIANSLVSGPDIYLKLPPPPPE